MDSSSSNTNGSQKRKERKERAKEFADEVEEESEELWARAKSTLLRPGVAGGIFGIGKFLISRSLNVDLLFELIADDVEQLQY